MSFSLSSNSSRASGPSQPPPPPPLLSQASEGERRSWSHEEEDALIVILKKVVADGWRQENAFRTGYLKVIEKELHVRFPGTDLTSKHASSKLTVWKKQYYIVLNMLNSSGFGWNDSTSTISVDDDVWNNYVKVRPHVHKMRNKPYRYFQDWIDIFGKDRATGKNSQGPVDLAKAAKGPENLAKAANQEPYIPYFDSNEFPNIQSEDVQNAFQFESSEYAHDEVHHESVLVEDKFADTPSPGECDSVNTNKRDGGKKIQPPRKRSRLDATSKEPIIVNLMDQFFKQQNQSIGIFIDKLDRREEQLMSNKPEVVDKTKLVLEALAQIGSLTEETRLYFAFKIATDARVTDLFLNFSEGERITFVNMMLAGKVLP